MSSTSGWIYPWNLSDHADRYVDIASGSLDRLDVAVSYHSLFATFPATSRAFLELDATSLFFAPDRDIWRSSPVVPRVASLQPEADAFALGRDAAQRSGVALGGWTVLMHNSGLALEMPEVSLRTLWGGPLASLLCLRHPMVRDYAARLITDIGNRADVVQLESAHWGTLPHHRHSKFPGRSPLLQMRILELCFCELCTADARRHGIDVDSLADAIESLWARSFDQVLDPGVELGAIPGFDRFQQRRAAAVADIAMLATSAAENIELVLFGDRERVGASIPELQATGASVRVLAYGRRDEVRRVIEGLRQADVLSPPSLGVSLLPEHVDAEGDFRESLAAAREYSKSIGVYHLGLATDERLAWLRSASRKPTP